MNERSDEAAGFRVVGRVQGVGFRQWTQRVGAELGLRGAVRNVSDGSVEVRASGAADAVAALGRKLAQGPAGARVERVERTTSALPMPMAGFRIAH